jgi:hypothetical protein
MHHHFQQVVLDEGRYAALFRAERPANPLHRPLDKVILHRRFQPLISMRPVDSDKAMLQSGNCQSAGKARQIFSDHRGACWYGSTMLLKMANVRVVGPRGGV